jgi:N4-gp56 family major capsid protein
MAAPTGYLNTGNPAGLAATIRAYFDKQLLMLAVQETVLDQWGWKKPLPKKMGAKTITYHRFSESANNSSGAVANVQTLAQADATNEGTPISTFITPTYTPVTVTLVQYGEAAKITDILSYTELFDALKDSIGLMGTDLALHLDNTIRNELVSGASGNLIYGQGAADFTALSAATNSGGKITMTDVIRGRTRLKINRAPSFGGKYVMAVPAQMGFDIQNDADWIDANNYADTTARFRGELGQFGGVRMVEHTNPFRETSGGTEGTYAAAGTIYRSFMFGRQSFGIADITTQSPMSPKIIINDKPDKADPLNQFITAGWKAFFGVKVLRTAWYVSLSTKTEYS